MIHSLIVVSYVMSLNQSEFIISREEFSNILIRMAPDVANKIYHDIGKRQKTGISPKKLILGLT